MQNMSNVTTLVTECALLVNTVPISTTRMLNTFRIYNIAWNISCNLTFDNMEINILVLTARHICFYPIICNFKISAVYNFLDLLFPDFEFCCQMMKINICLDFGTSVISTTRT